jgi:hypothetical protein
MPARRAVETARRRGGLHRVKHTVGYATAVDVQDAGNGAQRSTSRLGIARA